MTDGLLMIIAGTLWLLLSDSAASQRADVRAGTALWVGALLTISGFVLAFVGALK